ncbi:hypothetical protein LPJ66_001855 [Kickxella alabastrina]|uniref:Uncharacterized protein n=1 Tax=Kickxella alabastrina TaxID=61397 RepID=A0ACC1IS16_9FUNG|nr:hypothetical protein LPJ66_001855 [Kickxella alabastrina]
MKYLLRSLMQALLAAMLALAVFGYPIETTEESPSSDSAEVSQAMDRIFTTLVQRTFGPRSLDHAEIYYKTRFFTSHMQARMRYISSQQDLVINNDEDVISSSNKADTDVAGNESDDKELMLSKSEAEQLNSIMQEMWLASRKLYQSSGCLSYDLTLCNGQSSTKGSKFSDTERLAMAEWEKRLSTPFVAGKKLPKTEAEEIRRLMANIHAVLLENSARTA